MKSFVAFGAGLALGGIAGYFGYKKLEDMKKAKRVTERRTYPQYSHAHYWSPMKYKDVRFTTKEKAEEVLHKLIKIAGEYDRVTVADFYKAFGVTNSLYTDYNWGWFDCDIEHTSIKVSYIDPAGWYLDLPDPRPIN